MASRVTGELTATGFATLLVRAAARAPRGLLVVRSAGIERKIYLREGLVLFAASSSPADFLAERAVRSGILTRDQVREALLQVASGRRIGSALVELGHLTEAKLVELLLEQITSIAGDCFGLGAGTYELTIGDLPTQEAITLDEPVARMVIREIRKIRIPERLREATGDAPTPYFPVRGWRLRAAPEVLRDSLLRDLAELIADSPGITARNLVVSLPRSESEILQSLWILRSLELVGTPIRKDAAVAEDAGTQPAREPSAETNPFGRSAVPDAPVTERPEVPSPLPESAPSPPDFASLGLDPDEEESALHDETEADVDAALAFALPEGDPETTIFVLPRQTPAPSPVPAAPAAPAAAEDAPAPEEPPAISASLASELESDLESDGGSLELGDFDPERELDFGAVFGEETWPVLDQLNEPAEPRITSLPRPGETADPTESALLERALTAAEQEVDLVLALGVEKAVTTGDLAERPFFALLRDLSRDRATGTLIVKCAEQEKTVTLDRGRPIFATTNVAGERLTERLVSEGLLAPAALIRLTDFYPSARRIGGILLALRLLEPDALRKAIRRQVAEIITSLYGFAEGGFFFQERPAASNEEVIADLSLPELALRGAQRIGEPARLVDLLGGPDSRFRVTEEPSALFQALSLAPEHRTFVERIGPGGKVRDILELGPVSTRGASWLLFTLAASGVLERAGRERVTAPGIPNPERLLASPPAEEHHDDGQHTAAIELAQRWEEISELGDYAVLGAEPGASMAEISGAFEAAAPRWHPDRYRAYADAALLRLAGRVFDRHVLAFYRILNPAPKPETAADRAVREAMLVRPETSGYRQALVLDDDPESAGRLSSALTELGFAPEVAPGRVALRRFLAVPGRALSLSVLDLDLLVALDGESLAELGSAASRPGALCIGLHSGTTEISPLFRERFGISEVLGKGTAESELRQRLRELTSA